MTMKMTIEPGQAIRVIIEAPDGGRAQVFGTVTGAGWWDGDPLNTLVVSGEAHALEAS